MVVAGVDGARIGTTQGWVVVLLRDGRLDEMTFQPSFADVLAVCDGTAAIAVDIPIGHEDPSGMRNGGRRLADIDAKRFVGPRGSSVFPVSPPEVLAFRDQGAAVEEARRRGCIAPSAQLWNLRGRILDVAAAVRAGDHVFEAHPEASFRAMLLETGSDGHLEHPKSTLDGQHERLHLLHGAGLRPARSVGGVGRSNPVDVLDATALAWTARRIAEGRAATIPAVMPKDPVTGRPVAIWA